MLLPTVPWSPWCHGWLSTPRPIRSLRLAERGDTLGGLLRPGLFDQAYPPLSAPGEKPLPEPLRVSGPLLGPGTAGVAKRSPRLNWLIGSDLASPSNRRDQPRLIGG